MKAIWNDGQPYDSWIKTCDPEKREKLSSAFEAVQIHPPEATFLSSVKRSVHVLGIAEDWCGDVIRNTPVVAKLEQICPNLKLRIVKREEDLIVRFLTNGAEGIPKFIFLTDKWVETGNWGPRPAALKTLMAKAKAAGCPSDAYPRIKAFYAEDKQQTTIKELCTLISIATCDEI